MDLNKVAIDVVKNADVEGMQRCIEYSLQPKKILQVMLKTKRYECLPLFTETLFAQYNRYDVIALDIYVDLVSKDKVDKQIVFPKASARSRILHRAVERKSFVNFNLTHSGTDEFIFDKEDRIAHYREIILSDCIELFLIYKEDILSLYNEEYFCLHGHRFPQIVKELCVTEEDCKKFVLAACRAEPGEHIEELLLHIYKKYDCREDVYDYIYTGSPNHFFYCVDLVKIAARFDQRIISKLAELDPKLCARYFPVDV